MSRRVPDLIQPKLEHYLSLATEQLPCLNSFYLEGSIALGGFNERFSDIDIIAVLDRQLTANEIDGLRNIHEVIEEQHPRWQLSGSYIQLETLSRRERRAEPNLYYHNGILRDDGYFEPQSVEGWIVKNHGVAVLGPEPQSLPFRVDWSLLITEMKDNLNTYWAAWTRRPGRLITLLSDWGIQWTALGVLRQFYSFRENTITTKAGAGGYALKYMPARWHRLIQEALNIREGMGTSAYRSHLVRAIEAARFLKFIIYVCNADPNEVKASE